MTRDEAIQIAREVSPAGGAIKWETPALANFLETFGTRAEEIERQKGLCKKCGSPMRDGIAIKQTWSGTPEWPGDTIMTMSPGGSGRLIDCLKCSSCGRSVDVGSSHD